MAKQKKKWIQSLHLKKGALREKAQKAGAIDAQGHIKKTWLESKASGNDQTARQARLAIAFQKMR